MSKTEKETVNISDIQEKYAAAKAQLESLQETIGAQIKARDEHVEQANKRLLEMNEDINKLAVAFNSIEASRDTLLSLMPNMEPPEVSEE